MKATKRNLIGRKIVAVDWGVFNRGNKDHPRGKTTDPRLTLDDGRQLFFIVDETEVGEYGIRIHITEKTRKTQRVSP